MGSRSWNLKPRKFLNPDLGPICKTLCPWKWPIIFLKGCMIRDQCVLKKKCMVGQVRKILVSKRVWLEWILNNHIPQYPDTDSNRSSDYCPFSILSFCFYPQNVVSSIEIWVHDSRWAYKEVNSKVRPAETYAWLPVTYSFDYQRNSDEHLECGKWVKMLAYWHLFP